jgi:hypothetical protein
VSRLRAALPYGAFALLALGVVGLLQFGFAVVPRDADTAFNAAVGDLIARHGLLRAFPWTPMSWLSDRYADKELLFHLLYVPLGGLPWMTASKVVGTIAGASVLLALFVVLRAEKVRHAWLWALLPLAASSAFLFRFVLVRPHLLSIALALVVLWSAARGRWIVLLVASLAYPWAYIAWFLPVVLVAISEVARLLSGQRARWQPLAAAAAGVAAGVAIHPNSLNLIAFVGVVVGKVLVGNAWGRRSGLEMGTEFEPFSPDQWVELLLLVTLFALVAFVLAWRRRRSDPIPLAFALAALAFGLLMARTARFVEYFAPFAVAALALSLRDAPARVARLAPFALSAVALLYQGREEADLLARLREWPNRVPSYVAKAMQRSIPPGARVFTCEWGLTGYLMLALPDREFLVALDPTLFQLKDPELYALWYVITRQPPPDAARVVQDRFGARYVACFRDGKFQAFTGRLARTPGVVTLLESEDWEVFDLGAAR